MMKRNVVMKRYGLLLSSTAEGEPKELRLEIEAESEEAAKLRVPVLYRDKGYEIKEVTEI